MIANETSRWEKGLKKFYGILAKINYD
jgi:hypothetical protein